MTQGPAADSLRAPGTQGVLESCAIERTTLSKSNQTSTLPRCQMIRASRFKRLCDSIKGVETENRSPQQAAIPLEIGSLFLYAVCQPKILACERTQSEGPIHTAIPDFHIR